MSLINSLYLKEIGGSKFHVYQHPFDSKDIVHCEINSSSDIDFIIPFQVWEGFLKKILVEEDKGVN